MDQENTKILTAMFKAFYEYNLNDPYNVNVKSLQSCPLKLKNTEQVDTEIQIIVLIQPYFGKKYKEARSL